MVQTEQLAEAALAFDALRLRSLVQDWMRENRRAADFDAPVSTDSNLLAVAAGIVELLAERRNEPSPIWTAKIGAARSPVFLLKAAETMPRLRRLCENESPNPLRRRNIFTTPNFLELV